MAGLTSPLNTLSTLPSFGKQALWHKPSEKRSPSLSFSLAQRYSSINLRSSYSNYSTDTSWKIAYTTRSHLNFYS
ncbi:hypothetical protein XENTR_v10008633 [Xenopus tropicalis]|nr:hypothetical protein XENTR_v10008633 [Xenopus tropicalis]